MSNRRRSAIDGSASLGDDLKKGAYRVGKRIACGIAIGILVFIAARMAARLVGAGMVGWFIVIFGPIIIGYFVIWPQMNRLVYGLFGFLFHSEKPLEDAPLMSVAQGLRHQERFENAMNEYRKLAEAFPDAKEVYVDMIDMAVRDMGDEALGREIVIRGSMALEDEADRRELRDLFDCACAALKTKSEPVAKIDFEPFEVDADLHDR